MMEEIEKVVMVICMVIGFTQGFKTLKKKKNSKSKNQLFIEKAEANGSFTTAEAVKSEMLFGDRENANQELRNNRKFVLYKYVVDGKEYTRGLVYQNPGVATISHPHIMTIYYNPNNPKEALFKNEENEMDRAASGCYAAIVVTIGIIAGLFLSFRLIANIFLKIFMK